jgi:hypothetical protein
MKNHSIRIAIILYSLLACSVAVAEEGVKSLPDLVGTWTGEKKVYYQQGERQSTSELRISEQDGAYFRGYRIWEHSETEKEPLGHAGGKHAHQASEPILGIIGFDFKTIHMVEHDDWAHLHAHLVTPDTMEVVYVESGPNAAIFRVILKRKR